MLLPLFLEISRQLSCTALAGVKAALDVVTLIARRLAKPELGVSLSRDLLDGFLRVLPGGQISLVAQITVEVNIWESLGLLGTWILRVICKRLANNINNNPLMIEPFVKPCKH